MNKIKYKNYQVLLKHEKGNLTGFGCDFLDEAFQIFKKSKTAIKMIVFLSTHNDCVCAVYSMAHYTVL